ncbi:hypothetical protein [Photorhabdus sp. CRCIA-P01]|uniref:hypothetical protein n=1 Tax=Photorhabdus sp. CRCIA-P01 TaxID=2019570 RepID=UPI000E59B3BF|nr:hypothetical protein [Photorhabdus sp. CRCIA-P01]
MKGIKGGNEIERLFVVHLMSHLFRCQKSDHRRIEIKQLFTFSAREHVLPEYLNYRLVCPFLFFQRLSGKKVRENILIAAGNDSFQISNRFIEVVNR